jgi:DNA polymerase eta
MLSAKSFRPSINSVEQAEKWLHIFAADIYGRLVEDGVLEHRRRPRVITLHHRVAQSRSRQIPIPGSSKIDEDLLFDLAKNLLRQVVAEGQAWPCSNLSLSVSSFEDGVSKNKAIEGFLVRGDQAKSISQSTKPRGVDSTSNEVPPAEKKRRTDDGGIKRFFTHSPFPDDLNLAPAGSESPRPADQDSSNAPLGDSEPPLLEYTCDRCSKVIPEYEREEHDDWHFAKDLELQDRQEVMSAQQQSQQQIPPTSARGSGSSTRGRGGRSRGKPERGQKRLFFQ